MLIAVSYLLSQLTAGQDIKVIKDLGLAAMSLFGLFIAVFIGIGLVSKEVEKRSIYSLLAKPIRRQEFVVGKYLGPRADAVREPRDYGRRVLRRCWARWRGLTARGSARTGKRRRSIRRC